MTIFNPNTFKHPPCRGPKTHKPAPRPLHLPIMLAAATGVFIAAFLGASLAAKGIANLAHHNANFTESAW